MKKPLLSRHLQLRNMLFKHWKTKGLKKGEKIESQMILNLSVIFL